MVRLFCPGLSLRTEYLSQYSSDAGETWTVRVRGQSLVERSQLVTLILYLYNEGAGEMGCSTSRSNAVEEVFGHTPEVHCRCNGAAYKPGSQLL